VYIFPFQHMRDCVMHSECPSITLTKSVTHKKNRIGMTRTHGKALSDGHLSGGLRLSS